MLIKLKGGYEVSNKEVSFAHTLKKLRETHRITQVKLAEVLKVDQTAISKYERGIQLPELATLIKIANFFDISLDKLVYDVEQEAQNTVADAIKTMREVPLEDLVEAQILTIDGKIATAEEIKRAIKLTKLDRSE